MKRDLKLKAVYPHQPELVWRALTQSDEIAEWLMPNDFRAEVGHEFTLRTDPAPGFDGIVHCKVLELEEPRRLAYTWKGGPVDTVLSFDLEPVEQGTVLHVTQSGFVGFKAVLVSLILGSGSKKIYRKLLPAVLDRLAGKAGDVDSPECDKSGFWKVLAFVFSPFLKSKQKRG